MAKEVELEIRIDKDGRINVTPRGTYGSECLDLMKFFDKINGAKNITTEHNDDMKKSKTVVENIDNKLN